MEPSLQSALQEVTLAIKDDTEGNYPSAYQHYTASLNKFYEAHKLVTDSQLKDIIQEKMTEYKKRATEIKEMLLSNNNKETQQAKAKESSKDQNQPAAGNQTSMSSSLSDPSKTTATIATSSPTVFLNNNNKSNLSNQLSFNWPPTSQDRTKRSCVSIREWRFVFTTPTIPTTTTSPLPLIQSSTLRASTIRSYFLLWWLQAPTGSYVFEITNTQSQTHKSSHLTWDPIPFTSDHMNIMFTVSNDGRFKKYPSATDKQERENQIKMEWKGWVETWINEESNKPDEQIVHQGKQCIKVRKEEEKPNQEGGVMYEGILEKQTMRPHEIVMTEITRKSEKEVKIEKRMWLFDWKDILEANVEFLEPWEKADRVFEERIEKDLSEMGWRIKDSEQEQQQQQQEEEEEEDNNNTNNNNDDDDDDEVKDKTKSGVVLLEEDGSKEEVQVSNNVLMAEIVQMRYEMSVMRQQIKDLKDIVADLVITPLSKNNKLEVLESK